MIRKRTVASPSSWIVEPPGNDSEESLPATFTIKPVERKLNIGIWAKTCVLAIFLILSNLSMPIDEKMSSRLRESTTTSTAARTEAVRGMSYITPSSPKNEPFLRCDTTASLPSTSWIASHTPFSTMYNMSPISPSRMIQCPAGKLHERSFPTSMYWSALSRTSEDSKGILEMCSRSSCSTDHTAPCGTRSSATSVSATNVYGAFAFFSERQFTPKYSPGVTRGGEFIAKNRLAASSNSLGSADMSTAAPPCSMSWPCCRT
mmetsp:Transcript_48276/g.140770  ORF Transcript_48276/g.140770 Transcript_48276/m.140770 type:complete len:261 (-) Transcript_48276:1728-2510(-)